MTCIDPDLLELTAPVSLDEKLRKSVRIDLPVCEVTLAGEERISSTLVDVLPVKEYQYAIRHLVAPSAKKKSPPVLKSARRRPTERRAALKILLHADRERVNRNEGRNSDWLQTPHPRFSRALDT